MLLVLLDAATRPQGTAHRYWHDVNSFTKTVRQMQVWRVVFMISVKAHLDGKLGREAARERAIAIASSQRWRATCA
jgi:hypothetical protein